ncbi:MAG: helix-turn-helix transcriptional regulator [Chloroflexi bacterium]|nr:helix-turn-helix transcriptional regulator [Chloroflexota bacterium]
MTARKLAAAPSLGRLVRSNRERLHLTQAQLAERVGVSRSAISELEAGRIEQPRATVFARLGKTLGVPAVVLLAAAGYPAESEIVMGLEADELAVLAASIMQLAGGEREWLRTRLVDLRDLLVIRLSQAGERGAAGASSARGARRADAQGTRSALARAARAGRR